MQVGGLRLGGAELGVDGAGEPGVAAGLGTVGFFECAEHEHEGSAGPDFLCGGPAGVVEALAVAVDHGGGVGYGDVAVFGGGEDGIVGAGAGADVNKACGGGESGAGCGREGAACADEGSDAVGEALEGDGRLGLEAGYAEREEQEDSDCEGRNSVLGGHDGVFRGRFGERGGEITLHRVGGGVKGGLQWPVASCQWIVGAV